MSTKSLRPLLVLLFLGLIGAAAYVGYRYVYITQIDDILENPARFSTENAAHIAGKVKGFETVLGFSLLKIADSSGEILVLSERQSPRKGEYISVNGHAKQLFASSTLGVNLTIFKED